MTAFTHATDDLGWPLCRCGPCRQRSITMNAQYVARLFAKIGSPAPDLDRQEEIEAGNDYVTTPQQFGSAP